MIAYSKITADRSNIILTIVNLDPHSKQSGWVEVPLDAFGLDPHRPYLVHDLISDSHFQWNGSRNYVELNPSNVPAHVLKVR